MARPARSQADIRLAAAAERRVHGAALGYHPRRMKPVHLASSFILALTGRWRELEWLNKAAIPKSAPKPRSRVVDEYVSDNLLPRLRDLGMISEAVELEAFRRLRSHLNAAFNNDGAALGPVYKPYTTFGSDFSAPSSDYVSNYSKNRGHAGPFLLRIFGASPQGQSVIQKARELLAGPKPPLAVLGMPLVDQTDVPWTDDYDSQFGIIEPARLHAIATLMEPQTCALLRLLENMQARQSAYALRYFIIGLSAWLFVYMMKRSNDVPLLLLDALQGTNPRIRAQSRASYARQLDLFSGSYEHMRDSGAVAIDDADWEAFSSADDAYQMLDDHFRDLGVRAGLIQPRAPNAKRKHVELQADTLRAMVLSLLAPGPPRTLAELSAGLRDVWCICTGGDASDGERLQAAGYGPLDRDEDLEPNAAAFRDLLIRLGLAVEPSDGLTLCAIDAEELLQMSFSTDYLVSEALAAWITDDLDRSPDFAREGLPDCDVPRLMAALASAPTFQPSQFSLALVGFGLTTADLQQIAAANDLRNLSGLTNDLHEATEWRNRRDLHPRIVALARGYNPSVHGLQFFARASSSTLAKKLLNWAQRQSAFQATPPHRDLLETLATRPGLSALRSLDGVARFLSAWSSDAGHGINAPREALPALGLLADPKLFEADDLGRALERNLQIRESVTVLTPGEIRQLRARAARYNSEDRRRALVDALDRLAAFRRGAPDGALTVIDAELLVRPPRDVEAPNPDSPDDTPTPPVSESTETEDAVFTETAIDALLSGRQDDLDAIGSALDEAWAQFEENNDTLVAVANTSRGAVQLESAVDPNLLAWVRTFCAADRFGGLVETEVLDLQQALERSADCDPVFILPEEIWRRDGRSYSMEDLLAGWDQVLQPAGEAASLVEVWRRFVALRTALAGSIRQLVIHPREWLDTHSYVALDCRDYLDTARDLYHAVQQNYHLIWSQSRDWAQATLDALLSLDIVQVRMQSDGRTSAKAVMLPLHPLHLWRYSRLGSVLRGFTDSHAFEEADRAALIEELRRPEHFLSVVRVGATPAGRGLNQLLPVANDIHGLATFENLHNAVSSADGVETLVQALDHYILLYPNHSRPLRVAVINAPEPSKLLERLVKLLDERRHGPERLLGVEVDIRATEGHRDRLIAAATLDGRAQDLVHEKVAAGRLDLRVSERQAADLRSLINVELADRCYHVVALFDEASISIRRRRVERLLPMSPLCVRNEIVVDNMLGDISLSPHPGEPPFSDFVTMIQELEREQRDSTMFAAADADALRATIDALVTGPAPKARWAMLAD